jgi:hypothetical protein
VRRVVPGVAQVLRLVEAVARVAALVWEGLRREASGAPALPSAVAWVVVWAFRRDQALPWPALQPAAWFAHVMK